MSIVHNRSDLWNDPYLDFRGLARHISSSVKIRSWTATLQTSSETPPKSIVQHYYTTHYLNTSQWSVRKCKELSNLGWEVGKWWSKKRRNVLHFLQTWARYSIEASVCPAGVHFQFCFSINFLPIAPINPDSTDAKLVQTSNYNGVDKRFNGTVGASLLAGVKGQIAKSKLSLQTNRSQLSQDFSLEYVDEVCLRYMRTKNKEGSITEEEEKKTTK